MGTVYIFRLRPQAPSPSASKNIYCPHLQTAVKILLRRRACNDEPPARSEIEGSNGAALTMRGPHPNSRCLPRAQMAELVDAPASGAGARKGVEVRVLFWAPPSPPVPDPIVVKFRLTGFARTPLTFPR